MPMSCIHDNDRHIQPECVYIYIYMYEDSMHVNLYVYYILIYTVYLIVYVVL